MYKTKQNKTNVCLTLRKNHFKNDDCLPVNAVNPGQCKHLRTGYKHGGYRVDHLLGYII